MTQMYMTYVMYYTNDLISMYVWVCYVMCNIKDFIGVCMCAHMCMHCCVNMRWEFVRRNDWTWRDWKSHNLPNAGGLDIVC